MKTPVRRLALLTLAAILIWGAWCLSGAGFAQGAAAQTCDGEIAARGGH